MTLNCEFSGIVDEKHIHSSIMSLLERTPDQEKRKKIIECYRIFQNVERNISENELLLIISALDETKNVHKDVVNKASLISKLKSCLESPALPQAA